MSLPKPKRLGLLDLIVVLSGSSVIIALINTLASMWVLYNPPNLTTHEWTLMPGEGNCGHNDRGASYKSAEPIKDQCSSTVVNSIAVCWDGKDHRNASNPESSATMPWCTYKSVTPSQCKADEPKGLVWQCQKKSKI